MTQVHTTSQADISQSFHTAAAMIPAPVAVAPTAAQPQTNSGYVLDEIVALRDAHDVWFNGTYKASNDELYKLLAKCLDIYQRMVKKHFEIAAFETECINRQLSFNKNTSLLYKIVKYVFGMNNKRVSSYALALTVAQAVPVDPMDLPTWIANSGGIEKIRANKTGRISPAVRNTANKSTGTAAAHTASALQTYNVPGISIKDPAQPFVAVLARVNAAGLIELIAPITDRTAVDAVLAAYGESISTSTAANVQVATINAQNAAVGAALNP